MKNVCCHAKLIFSFEKGGFFLLSNHPYPPIFLIREFIKKCFSPILSDPESQADGDSQEVLKLAKEILLQGLIDENAELQWVNSAVIAVWSNKSLNGCFFVCNISFDPQQFLKYLKYERVTDNISFSFSKLIYKISSHTVTPNLSVTESFKPRRSFFSMLNLILCWHSEVFE